MSQLVNDFYTIKEKTLAPANTVKVEIELNAAHPVYKGHFPEMPVMPGVLQIQIIKEILEEHLQKKLQLLNGDNIKFMGMIIPTQNSLVNFELNYTTDDKVISCEAKLFCDNSVFTKFKGQYKITN